MKILTVALLMLICISICCQASGEIITGEWKREMTGEKAYIHLGYADWSSGKLFDTVAVFSGPGEQYPEVDRKLLRTLQCLGLEGDWALVTDAEPSFWNADPFEGIGYINISGLEKRPDDTALHYANIPVKAPNDCCLLRYPLDGDYSEYLGSIREGEDLLLLSVYGEFVYVEANLDGIPTRGFLAERDYSVRRFLKEIYEAGMFAGLEVDLIDLYTYQYTALKKDSIAAGDFFTVALKSDGTVVARGKNEYGQCNVQDWHDIIAVSTGNDFTIGLKSDGTVVATGNNQYGQCEVGDWSEIVAISAGEKHTVGLTKHGYVVVTGDNTCHQHDVDNMRKEYIVAISAGGTHTVGLTSDGRVLVSGNYVDRDDTDIDPQLCRAPINTRAWSRITDISAGNSHAVAQRADGNVIAEGESANSQINVWDWENASIIAAGGLYSFGLFDDGTIQVTGCAHDYNREIWLEKWPDILFMTASNTQLIGVRKDGTIENYQFDFYDYPYYELSDWTDIGLHEDKTVFIQ